MARQRKKAAPSEPELTQADIAKAFKSVSLDGDIVISNHDLQSQREDREADERQEGFNSGRLQRATRINMSGGVN